MLRRLSFILLAAMPLLLSCGKAQEQVAPEIFRAGYVWQKGQWDKCSAQIQKHLDPSVREKEMRTLDAAYVAILKMEETDETSYSVPFTTDGVPCEARVLRSGAQASVTVLRNGVVIGVFTKDEAVYTGESTEIRFVGNPVSGDPVQVHTNMLFMAEGVTLATLKADGPLELVDVSLELPEGITLKGNVEARRLWGIMREITDEETEEKVTPLVEEAAGAIHVDVFYTGDLSAPLARLTMVPLHYLNRYDDYWTWNLVILANDGGILNNAWNALGGVDDATASFCQAWRNMMPHILS